ncbi:hypothetical protein AGR1A_Cc20092 [Agrobacterium fabacearum CFBP 5771]|uniref:hypothetical protein n=1 Tax=Agrobacterium tumefaciens TaxID=358 RepID=UPI0004723FA6|nr:hypothetical protein [Agrobacterium tumefaciens]CVI14810.1 hypothetical protein AGR1A_Cc20092 [Agrobacterium fabacearum CFBP 5771]
MISVEGYEPLIVFWQTARNIFREKLDRERWARQAAAREKEEERPQFPFTVWNSDIAARFAVWELFATKLSETGRKPQILRPDGVRLDLSLGPIWPSFRLSEKLDEAIGIEHADEIKSGKPVFGLLAAVKRDYWLELMLTTQCFSENTPGPRNFNRAVDIVDWENGCLNLSHVKRYYDGMDMVRQGFEIMETFGTIPAIPKRIRDEVANPGNRSYFSPLLPFDGLPIIAPTDWLKELEPRPQERTLALNANSYDKNPVDEILRLFEEGKTKPEIKTLVTDECNLSIRQFEKKWADAANKNSDLSIPGRRKKKS